MTIRDTKILKTHFLNDPRHGRTTTLVHRVTGEVLFIGMGAWTRAEMWRAYERATTSACA